MSKKIIFVALFACVLFTNPVWAKFRRPLGDTPRFSGDGMIPREPQQRPLYMAHEKRLPLADLAAAFEHVKTKGVDVTPAGSETPFKMMQLEMKLPKILWPRMPLLKSEPVHTEVLAAWGQWALPDQRHIFPHPQLRITLGQEADASKIINGFVVPMFSRKGDLMDARLAQVTGNVTEAQNPLYVLKPGPLGLKFLRVFQNVVLQIPRPKIK